MGLLALVFGLLGGLIAVMGVIIAVEVIPAVADLPYMFWLVLSAILLLICIAFNTGQRGLE